MYDSDFPGLTNITFSGGFQFAHPDIKSRSIAMAIVSRMLSS
jgi:hypothetical protein